MSQVARRRTDQFRDLMAVLELRTVNLDKSARTAKQDFGRSLDHSRLARTCWTQKEQVTDRTARHCHTCQINLVHVHDSANCAILTDNLARKPTFEIENLDTSHFGIK